MKLVNFKNLQGYWFVLSFENGEIKETDLAPLIAKYVPLENINTAKINQEWGCLEFNNGLVDIEPKTLYRFAEQNTVNP
jgi:hypothetical protein